MYESESGRENGIQSIKKNVPEAQLIDLTIGSGLKDETTDLENLTKIGSIRTFFSELEKLISDDDHIYFFRGHSNANYDLTPSIYRDDGWIKNEDIIFKELILRCPTDFDNNDSTFQDLVKMQHFSLPTRLLDLTSNPLIALYFATERNSTLNGEVIVFKIPKNEIKYYDSDTVSVIANISRRPAEFSINQEELSIDEFNDLPEIKFLLHEIKKEKPYFLSLIKKEHLESVICVKPKLNNARIIKQDGAFFLFGISKNKSSPAKIPSKYRITLNNPLIISHDKKEIIRDQLKTLGITRGTIYPDIDNVANFIKETYKNK
ncbi:MAG: FRG domain-containing protein [Methylotenera sp.]|nr:FRG domain-containing protein [Methylotenera sp.]MDO9234204.1 FRG domain-containing protein [Methylotenera sp.]MDP2403125.1 FRG domain-containing protein [Methylotenera sp.]MDP3096168.1 FRG domain-containing protein [Methylotenera sp.]MDZ4223083.1 FRG domain-containing protein [Methylotenera sp.]